jgi:hypothetical protein
MPVPHDGERAARQGRPAFVAEGAAREEHDALGKRRVDVGVVIAGAVALEQVEAGRHDLAVVLGATIGVGEERVAVGVEEVRGAVLPELHRESRDDVTALGEGGKAAPPARRQTRQEGAEGVLGVGVAHGAVAVEGKPGVARNRWHVTVVREEVHAPSELAGEGLRVRKAHRAEGREPHVGNEDLRRRGMGLEEMRMGAVEGRGGLAHDERVAPVVITNPPTVLVGSLAAAASDEALERHGGPRRPATVHPEELTHRHHQSTRRAAPQVPDVGHAGRNTRGQDARPPAKSAALPTCALAARHGRWFSTSVSEHPVARLPRPSTVLRGSTVALLSLLLACGGESFDAPSRAVGDRTPLSGPCDELDLTRCHLPWPSSRFLVADDSTETGLALSLAPGTYLPKDDASVLERADGFSRISALVVGASAILGEAEVKAWISEPGHPSYGEEIPLRVVVENDHDRGESFIVAYPARPMPENAAHVAVVFAREGLEPGPATLAALDLQEPASQAEADLRGYHAPTRAFLAERGVDPRQVARVWDFVTRSQVATVSPLLAMREAMLAAAKAGVAIEIDSVAVAPKPSVAMIVEGTIELPFFVTDELPDPTLTTTHVARFRMLVPAGSGDYPALMFGHGLGGSYDDGSFDEALAVEGFGKVGLDFHGWTADSFLDTLGGFVQPFVGTAHAAGFLMQSLAERSAVQFLLGGELGDLLAADDIAGMPNPAAGRRPDLANPIVGGGSLGATTGFAYAHFEPSIRYGALNVGGAGWSHFLRTSIFFAPLAALMKIDFGSPLDISLVIAQSQTNWDYVDGAIWADHRADPPVLLIQESIGDPVLPNIGTELMAMSSGAAMVGAALEPFGDLEVLTLASERSAITQFRVSGDATKVHGFAETDSPGGEAARDQIRHFLATARSGAAEILIPEGCLDGRCDFSE